MRLWILIETAFKAIRKNARRSFLTMVGLIIGTAAVITIVSVGRGYEKYQMKRLMPDSDGETIQTTISFNPNDSKFENTNLTYFNHADFELIEKLDGVLKVEYKQDNQEEVYKSKQVSIKGYQQSVKMQLVKKSDKNVFEGRGIKEEDTINENKVIMISRNMAEDILEREENLDELVGEVIEIEKETFKIAGIFEGDTGDNFEMQIPAAVYYKYFGIEVQKYLLVTISNSYSSKRVGENIVKVLTKNGSVKELGTYSNASSAAMMDSLSSLFQSLTLLISFVGAISLFISGVGVMNMIYTSVSERTKEIGIRRSLGATERTIQMQFMFEGLALTLMGGLIGYLIGLFIAKVISKIMDFDFIPDLFTAGLAVIISIFVGVAFSYLPSKSATEKDIVELVK